MKKFIYSKLTGLILLAGVTLLSSCLKDDRYVDFGASKPIAELPISGLSNFGKDAITEAGDTIVRQFAVNIASPNIPDKDITVTLAVDNSIIATYLKSDASVAYLPLPANSFVFKDQTVTIAKGTRTKIVSVTFYKDKLNPSLSYMLPITIKDAQGITISGNFGIHYYHFIGNDFAGPYQHQFTRTPAAGNFTYADGVVDTFSPDSPTQFEVVGGYYTQDIRYVVNFTKTGSGPTATYSHFSVSINADDIEARFKPNGISVTVQPTIVGYVEKEYTFAEALKLFEAGLQYDVVGGSGARHNLDQFKK